MICLQASAQDCAVTTEFTAAVSAIVWKVGKVRNVTSELLSVSVPIAPDMDNAEREFASVTQDGRESIVKHVRSLSTLLAATHISDDAYM